MDESTKNIFKKKLEYLINFETEQANHLNSLRQIINQPLYPRGLRFFEKFETGFKDLPQLAQIIFEAFDSINFNFDDLIREVENFNTDFESFRSYFTILSPSAQILDFIVLYLSSLIQNLKNINDILGLTFSNSRIFLKFLTNLFRI